MTSDFAVRLALTALTLALDATAVLLVAWVATLATKRRSSLRHACWVAAFTALLLLPLVSFVHRGTKTVPIEMPAAHSVTAQVRNVPPAPTQSFTTLPNVVDMPTISMPVRPAPPRRTDWPGAARVLLGIWLAGSAVLLLRIGVAAQGLRSLCRSSSPTEWRNGEFKRLSEHFNLRRPVALRVSRPGRQVSAMTWGVRRPVILLPSDAAIWSDRERESILLHELAHVHRCDSLYQFLAALVTTLFWFHPAVWLASWAMRSEAEMAADDAVVRAGVRASDYASHLLTLASRCRSYRGPRLSLGVFMMKRSGIERRVRSIVDPDRRRRGATVTQVGSIGVAALLVVFFVTSVRPIFSTRSEVSEALFNQALFEATQHQREPVLRRIAIERAREKKRSQRLARAGLPVEIVVNRVEPKDARRQPHRPSYVVVHTRAKTLQTQAPVRMTNRTLPVSVHARAAEPMVALRAPFVTHVSEARAIPLVVRAPLASPESLQVVANEIVAPAMMTAESSGPRLTNPAQKRDAPVAVQPFHAVVVDSEVQLTLQVGRSNGCSVTCPNAGPQAPTVGGAADTLNFSVARGESHEGLLTATVVDGVLHLHGAQRVDVIATTPTLDGLQVFGNSVVRCMGISTRAFALAATGNSTVELNGHAGSFQMDLSGHSAFRGIDLTGQRLQAEVSGSSCMDLGAGFGFMALDADGGSSLAAHGHVNRLDVNGKGGSSLDCSSLIAHVVDATAASGVSMRVCATNSMTADAKGSSKIEYSGKPKSVTATQDASSQVFF